LHAASTELHDAFVGFLSDPALFCLPVTIDSEQLAPLQPIRFASSAGASANQFFSSLPLLVPHLDAKIPIYLLLRRNENSSSSTSSLVAVTYIPATAPVRSKTIFASTRATLVRELGSEKFSSTVFATDAKEVLGEEEWRERDADADVAAGVGEDKAAESRRDDLMSVQEKELQALRIAENDEGSVSRRRDVGLGGTFGGAGGEDAVGEAKGVLFPVEQGVKDSLKVLVEEGRLVQLVCILFP
jgi:twinfilin-like protein